MKQQLELNGFMQKEQVEELEDADAVELRSLSKEQLDINEKS